MNHDHSLKELLLLPDGPPEGVWQAAMDFAFTSENETPGHLVPDINADNTQTSEADVDADAEEGVDDQTADLPVAPYEDQGDNIDPPLRSSDPGDLDEAGEDYGG